jgi:endonuclease/exonuclease/phosphatase family metal-dependent hydrolase
MIRVMTANLNRGRAEVGAFADAIATYEPDVVAVQELGHPQSAVLESRYGFGRLEPEGSGEGGGLISSTPMTVDRMALPGRSGYHGELRTDEGRVSVIGVHLLNPLDALMGRAPFRRDQVHALCNLLDVDPTDRILLGDLNATSGWPAYRKLRRHLTDPVANFARALTAPAEPTWAPNGRREPVLRIDHVLTVGFRATDVMTFDLPGSDHRALLVDLVRVNPVEAPDPVAERAQRAA